MSEPIRVASPPSKPLLVFDGDCGFCRRWIARWQNATGDAVDYLPFQDESIAARFPEIPKEKFQEAVHLIRADGSVFVAAEAVFRSLADAGRERWLLWMYTKLRGFAEVSELVYEEVASHREFLSKLDRVYSGPGLKPLRYIRVRFFFLRGLALIYLVAFASLWGQIDGLVGSRGIVPAQSLMDSIRSSAEMRHMGLERYRLAPTLAWWSASDQSLRWQCAAGTALSLVLLFGIAPAPALFLLWLIYLSLCTVCSPFLDFQWDQLLLETGFLAIFFAPLQMVERPLRQSAPSSLVVFLLRWLLFRLMFESGCVKLFSGDPTWAHLTALQYHYETQPLPTWIGWYAHLLPAGPQAMCTLVLLGIELLAPVLIFSGRRARLTAAALFVFLQVLIMLTGNYTFFNWLTILLCLPLLDDGILELPRPIASTEPALPTTRRCPRWPRFVLVPVAAVALVVTSVLLLFTMNIQQPLNSPVAALMACVAPFRSFNSYGLFAMMTQSRPEIIIEGSNNGTDWQPYEFEYKPGDLKKKPAFVAPYQPRLDWQMWFAALGGPRNNPWVLNLEVRLLQNSAPVLGLMGRNPFPKAPPRYIRSLLYQYHFTSWAEYRATGEWWKRDYLGVFIPAVSLPQHEGQPETKRRASFRSIGRAPKPTNASYFPASNGK